MDDALVERRRTVNTILAGLLVECGATADVVDRVRCGNAACDKLLAALSRPDAAATDGAVERVRAARAVLLREYDGSFGDIDDCYSAEVQDMCEAVRALPAPTDVGAHPLPDEGVNEIIAWLEQQAEDEDTGRAAELQHGAPYTPPPRNWYLDAARALAALSATPERTG